MLTAFLLTTIVYLDFIKNSVGGKYHDTEYYEDNGFRMKSFCDRTIYRNLLYIVNADMIPILPNRLARVTWPLSQGESAQMAICRMQEVICKLRRGAGTPYQLVHVCGLGAWTVVRGRIQSSLSQNARPKPDIKARLS